LDNFSFPFLGD